MSNTTTEINNTYRLYMGFYEGIKVGVNTPNMTADYDFDTWNNEVFAERFEKKLAEVKLTVQLPSGTSVSIARLCTPESEGEKILDFTVSGETVHISVPENTFSGYALIILE